MDHGKAICLIDLKDYERDQEDIRCGTYEGLGLRIAKEIFQKGREFPLSSQQPEDLKWIAIVFRPKDFHNEHSWFVPSKYFKLELSQ